MWRYLSGKSRRGWRQKYWGLRKEDLPRLDASLPVIWMHAVSVGEVNLLRPLVKELGRDHSILITTTTESGFDLAKTLYPDQPVCFFPLDFTWAIRRSIDAIRPNVIVLAELELWPNLIAIAHQKKVPIVIANGRLGEKSYSGYQRFKWLLGGLFEKLAMVGAQTQSIGERFAQLGCHPDSIRVTGNLKFDNAVAGQDQCFTNRLVSETKVSEQDQVLVAGSTQLEEDLIVVEMLQSLGEEFPALKVVLVPRHPERCPSLFRELQGRGIKFQVRSKPSTITNDARLIVIDVIGELGSWWARADLGYVGGSMGAREGQNMIEPSALGVPICFGPRTKNFQDVVSQLLTSDAARVIQDQAELIQFVRDCFESSESMQAMGKRAASVVRQNLGATDKTLEMIRETIAGK